MSPLAFARRPNPIYCRNVKRLIPMICEALLKAGRTNRQSTRRECDLRRGQNRRVRSEGHGAAKRDRGSARHDQAARGRPGSAAAEDKLALRLVKRYRTSPITEAADRPVAKSAKRYSSAGESLVGSARREATVAARSPIRWMGRRQPGRNVARPD